MAPLTAAFRSLSSEIPNDRPRLLVIRIDAQAGLSTDRIGPLAADKLAGKALGQPYWFCSACHAPTRQSEWASVGGDRRGAGVKPSFACWCL
jgi:hypothetical protein